MPVYELDLTLEQKQRTWVRKRYGDAIADSLKVEKVLDRWVSSSVMDGGRVYSHQHYTWRTRRDGTRVEQVTHALHVGEPAGPGKDWVYPDWVKLPVKPRLIEPGTTVLCGGAIRHNGCRAVVLSARVKVGGGVPRNFRKYHLECVDERCAWPKKEFRMELGGMLRGARLIELPVTVEAIKAQRNTELRRGMIELYGLAEYLRDSDATLRSQDDWGKLWVLPEPGEDLMLVEMVNSTARLDGTRSVYFERVPPGTRTPLAGLAWQADMSELEYASMDVQT